MEDLMVNMPISIFIRHCELLCKFETLNLKVCRCYRVIMVFCFDIKKIYKISGATKRLVCLFIYLFFSFYHWHMN